MRTWCNLAELFPLCQTGQEVDGLLLRMDLAVHIRDLETRFAVVISAASQMMANSRSHMNPIYPQDRIHLIIQNSDLEVEVPELKVNCGHSMKVIVTGHTTVVAMSVFKLDSCTSSQRQI